MDILYLLIPLSLVFVVVIAYAFLWAVKSGQFEDMEGPAHRILMDDEPASLRVESASQPSARSMKWRDTRVRGTRSENQLRTSSSRPMPCI